MQVDDPVHQLEADKTNRKHNARVLVNVGRTNTKNGLQTAGSGACRPAVSEVGVARWRQAPVLPVHVDEGGGGGGGSLAVAVRGRVGVGGLRAGTAPIGGQPVGELIGIGEGKVARQRTTMRGAPVSVGGAVAAAARVLSRVVAGGEAVGLGAPLAGAAATARVARMCVALGHLRRQFRCGCRGS